MWKPSRIPSAKPIKLPKPLKIKLAKPPPEKYIVVTNLWLYLSSPNFFTMMGGWLQCAFGSPPLAIYHNGNQAEYIIVEFSSNVDVRSRLGAHHPCEFIKDVAWLEFHKAVKTHASVIYEYNYPVHKDPSIKFDNKLNTWPDPFSSLSPFKWGADYPPPRLPDTFLSAVSGCCALPLPRDLLKTLEPPLDPPATPHDQHFRSSDASLQSNPQPIPKRSADKPHEQTKTQIKVEAPTQPAIWKVGKLDPYEEEENANALFRSTLDAEVKTEPDVEQKYFVKDVDVKSEDDFQRARESRRNASTLHVKEKPSEGGMISMELRSAYGKHQSVKMEPGHDERRSQILQSRRVEVDRHIKPEPRDDVVPGTGATEIKGEEDAEERKFVGDISRERVERRDRPSTSHSRPRKVKVEKKEEEEGSRICDSTLQVKLENHDDRLWTNEPQHHGSHVKHEPSSPRDLSITVKEEERKADINGPFEKTSLPSWRMKRERNVVAVFGSVSEPSESLLIEESHQPANSYAQSDNATSSTRCMKREYDDYSRDRGCNSTQLWSDKDREDGTGKRRKREF
ncbi:hypothetical protein E1B28_010452 [Marasmius oreades]|uniref:Uncharacterized protein n=1 Tax=Marasmius oreades TaxID=181124 RepID=A0A9P7RYC0_9AGAR|nr:uncharacterized protein E1B28_010452 [Marasmius oreades]KAG7091416.1 hypothetical protein E1B28_010452 [Marasmius oreades]